jgi:hypothetical protein
MIKYLRWLGLLIAGWLYASSALAVCPLCTVAVSAGIGFFEWIGLNDVIIGLWVGALVISLSFWTADWLHQKNRHFPYQGIIFLLVYNVFITLPLYYPLRYIGQSNNTLWCIDRLLLGILLGEFVFFVSSVLHFSLKMNHGGRVYFPLQKVIIPIVSLILLSLIFYFLV